MIFQFTKTYPEDPRGPDLINNEPARHRPDAIIVPFHCPHPVTGKKGRHTTKWMIFGW